MAGAEFYDPQFEFVGFRYVETEAKMGVICKMLDVLEEINAAILKTFPNTPRLYDAGICYVEEKLGQDKWQDIARTLQLKAGDCEDLAAYRVSELRHAGENARHVVEHRKGPGLVLYHIKVIRGDGTIEDPSAVLGMPGGHLGKHPPFATDRHGNTIPLRKEPLVKPKLFGLIHVGQMPAPEDLAAMAAARCL